MFFNVKHIYIIYNYFILRRKRAKWSEQVLREYLAICMRSIGSVLVEVKHEVGELFHLQLA